MARSVLTSLLMTGVGFALAAAEARAATHRVAHADETVVLLHGLGRESSSMWLLAHRLRQAGYSVHPFDYPSREESINELVSHLHEDLAKCCVGDASRLHFVTHSLGGILTRAYIATHRPANLGRVVMLSPPNQGSKLADLAVANRFLRWAAGPTVSELGTDRSSLPNRLGPADFELGIIAGSRSMNPIGSWMLDGPDDGAVAVESMRLEGMSAFLVVPRTHTFIMNSAVVTREIVHFLEHGRFSQPTGEAGG